MERDDRKVLIDDIVRQEQMMIDIYGRLLEDARDRDISSTLDPILRDERRHLENARKMLRILEE
jgi:rubrerythrin